MDVLSDLVDEIIAMIEFAELLEEVFTSSRSEMTTITAIQTDAQTQTNTKSMESLTQTPTAIESKNAETQTECDIERTEFKRLYPIPKGYQHIYVPGAYLCAIDSAIEKHDLRINELTYQVQQLRRELMKAQAEVRRSEALQSKPLHLLKRPDDLLITPEKPTEYKEIDECGGRSGGKEP